MPLRAATSRISNLRHQAVLGAKRLYYGRRGEPYPIQGMTLRYLPGSRPVRTRYRTSPNAVTRYDALQVELIARSLKAGDRAIDIGAHAGQYAIIMAALCGPTGQVIAFEPDPHARKLLAKNLKLNPQVSDPRVEPIALSDAEGIATLYSRGGDSNSSLARSALFSEEDIPYLQEIKVRITRLDSYVAELSLPALHLAKIDAEGAEIRILRGAKSLLESDALIICELHPYVWHEFGDSFQDLKNIVLSAGRRIRYLDQSEELKENPVYGTTILER